jgi:PDZ domain-containing secreted protein
MPKLLVKFFGDPGEDLCELEEAKYLLDFTDRIVLVDGREVRSYEELLKIVNRKEYTDREFVEVVQIPALAGG